MKLIVAVNNLNYIGKEGKMLWESSDDFKHFKMMTMGGSLIVGGKTFIDCMGERKLMGRKMHVVGTSPTYLSLFQAVEQSIFDYLSGFSNEIWVIGGSQIYNQLVHLCDEIHISYIDNNEVGDTRFEVPDNYRGKVFDYYFKENEKL